MRTEFGRPNFSSGNTTHGANGHPGGCGSHTRSAPGQGSTSYRDQFQYGGQRKQVALGGHEGMDGWDGHTGGYTGGTTGGYSGGTTGGYQGSSTGGYQGSSTSGYQGTTGGTNGTQGVTGGTSGAGGSTNAEIEQLFEEINQMRAAEGKAPLTLDTQLSAVAQEHSDYMASSNNMTHDGPGDLGDVMKLGFSSAAQNVGGSQSAEDALQQMYNEKNDPSGEQGHYQNIEGDYSKVGIGIDANGWLTIDFGK